MKRTFAIIALAAFISTFAVSCKHNQPCPAYGKAGKTNKHRSV
ncbi:MAG: hypothetical protein ACJ76F_09730 [Bacteroidia bacterium]